MNIRERRQVEASNAFLNTNDFRSIILAAPRMGKVRTTFKIIEQLNPKNILLLFPRNDIKKGWIDESNLLNFNIDDIDFFTFSSLHKINKKYDLIIIDEINELSLAKQKTLAFICNKIPTLGLTGTLTKKSADIIYNNLKLPVCFNYRISTAVNEGVLAPYQIHVHTVDLDDKIEYLRLQKWSNKYHTEHFLFNYIYDKVQLKKQQLKDFKDEKIKLDEKQLKEIYNFIFFNELKLINIIQNSKAKLFKTISLLENFKDNRVLVFCGTTQTTDQIGIPVYHSKAKEKKIFEDFANGSGFPHLATIKMMQAGKCYARYKPL